MTTATTNSSPPAFKPSEFRGALMGWYCVHGRHALRWRLTRDPYAVLVSEIMLQQTQVERVLPYYEEWLERWPGFAELADASPAEVIRAWRGLGYNRRGLNLHRLAHAVVADYGGVLPQGRAELLALPGIGAYTAAAVQSFALEEDVAVADTNIARVVARAVMGAPSQHEVPARALAEALRGLLPNSGVRDHNLALMDLGAMVCRARTPECGSCPVSSRCTWNQAGRPAAELARRPAVRFEETARFARGRIIDALRDGPATDVEMSAMLPAIHVSKVDIYLSGLERDGLVVRDERGWSLPG